MATRPTLSSKDLNAWPPEDGRRGAIFVTINKWVMRWNPKSPQGQVPPLPLSQQDICICKCSQSFVSDFTWGSRGSAGEIWLLMAVRSGWNYTPATQVLVAFCRSLSSPMWFDQEFIERLQCNSYTAEGPTARMTHGQSTVLDGAIKHVTAPNEWLPSLGSYSF